MKKNITPKKTTKKARHPDVPGRITTDQLIEIVPVNKRTVGKWIEAGIIKRVGELFSTRDTLKNIFNDWRGRKSVKKTDELRAKHLEFDLAVKKKNYLSRSEVEIALAKVFAMLSEMLNELPEKIAAQVAPDAPEEVEPILTKIITDLLEMICSAVVSEFKVDPSELDESNVDESDEDECETVAEN